MTPYSFTGCALCLGCALSRLRFAPGLHCLRLRPVGLALRPLRSFQIIHISDAELGKLRPQTVKIDSKLACLEALPRFLLLRKPFAGKSRHFCRIFTLDDDDTVGIRNNRVTGTDDRAGANDRPSR